MSFLPEKSSFQIAHPPPIRKLFTSAISDDDKLNMEHSDTFQVFLRIKPNSELKHSNDCIRIEDNVKLVCKPPSSSKHKKLEKVEYTFSNIFGPKTSQTEIFSNCVINCVEDLLYSRNSLIFTYGTTNAGKTFTVQGTAKSPGIIPQCLSTLFSNIEIHSELTYVPCMAKDLRKMLTETSQKKLRVTNEILRSFRASCKSSQTDSSHFMQSSQNTLINLNIDKPSCSVWISFVEVYNETIYDLLDPKVIPRKALKIAADPEDNFYVKELKHIYVGSAEEAFTIYQYGKKNLNIASTKMNENSSRSHCIFTIYIINQDDESNPKLSKLCICDLAGSERVTKTQNAGQRLKESGNINGSLFQLNRCLRAIRDNQMRGTEQPIPYRYSNLTKLLHSALDDRTNEKIIMIVNINPSAELFDETQQVLKTCAIASKIKNKPLTHTFQRNTRFSSLICGRETVSENGYRTPIGDISETYENSDDEVQELLELLVKRDTEIKELKRQIDIREEYHETSKKNLTEYCEKVETTLRKRITSLEQRLEKQKEYFTWKVAETKKSAILGNVDETIRSELDERNTRIEELESQIMELLSKDVKNASSVNLNSSVIKEEISSRDIKIEELQKKIAQLEHELQNANFSLSEKINEKDLRIKDLESIVEEAKEEYLFLENKLNSESSKIALLEDDLSEKNEMIQHLECRIEDLEQKNESIEEMLSKNTIEHELILHNIETDRDKRLAERENEIAQLKEKLAEVELELITLRVVNEDLNRKLLDENKDNKIIALKTQVEELSGKLTKNATERKSEVASLKSKISALIEEQKKLQTNKDSELAALSSEIETLTKKLNDKDELIDNLRSTIEKLNEENDQLRNDKDTELAAPLEREIEPLSNEKDDVQIRKVKMYVDGKVDKIGSIRKSQKEKLDKPNTPVTDAVLLLKKLNLSEVQTFEMNTEENTITKRYNTRGAAFRTPGQENSSNLKETQTEKKKRGQRKVKTPLAVLSVLDDSSDANVFRNTCEKGKTPDHRKPASKVVKKMFPSSPDLHLSSPQLYVPSSNKKKLFSSSPSTDCYAHDYELSNETSRIREMTGPLQTVKMMKKKK